MTRPTKPDQACKGAWCQIRNTCPNHTKAKRRRDDAERLCLPSLDGERKMARCATREQRERQIIAILSVSPLGMSSRNIGRKLGITQEAAMLHLRRMRGAGICSPTGSTYFAVWAIPGFLDAAREHANAIAEAAVTDETRRRRERKAASEACSEKNDDLVPDMPVRQVTVSAISAPRLPIGTMVTSIFALGGAA